MKLSSPAMSRLQSTVPMIFTRSRRTNPETVEYLPQVRTITVDATVGRPHTSTLLPHTWQAACLLILVAAAVLRLYHLSLKPLHHDEGVNAYFLGRLFRQGMYHYNPANFHGPTLYYFSLLPRSLLSPRRQFTFRVISFMKRCWCSSPLQYRSQCCAIATHSNLLILCWGRPRPL